MDSNKSSDNTNSNIETKKSFKQELILRTIKIIDIAYIFSFYAADGFFLSIFLEKIFLRLIIYLHVKWVIINNK